MLAHVLERSGNAQAELVERSRNAHERSNGLILSSQMTQQSDRWSMVRASLKLAIDQYGADKLKVMPHIEKAIAPKYVQANRKRIFAHLRKSKHLAVKSHQSNFQLEKQKCHLNDQPDIELIQAPPTTVELMKQPSTAQVSAQVIALEITHAPSVCAPPMFELPPPSLSQQSLRLDDLLLPSQSSTQLNLKHLDSNLSSGAPSQWSQFQIKPEFNKPQLRVSSPSLFHQFALAVDVMQDAQNKIVHHIQLNLDMIMKSNLQLFTGQPLLCFRGDSISQHYNVQRKSRSWQKVFFANHISQLPKAQRLTIFANDQKAKMLTKQIDAANIKPNMFMLQQLGVYNQPHQYKERSLELVKKAALIMDKKRLNAHKRRWQQEEKLELKIDDILPNDHSNEETQLAQSIDASFSARGNHQHELTNRKRDKKAIQKQLRAKFLADVDRFFADVNTSIEEIAQTELTPMYDSLSMLWNFIKEMKDIQPVEDEPLKTNASAKMVCAHSKKVLSMTLLKAKQTLSQLKKSFKQLKEGNANQLLLKTIQDLVTESRNAIYYYKKKIMMFVAAEGINEDERSQIVDLSRIIDEEVLKQLTKKNTSLKMKIDTFNKDFYQNQSLNQMSQEFNAINQRVMAFATVLSMLMETIQQLTSTEDETKAHVMSAVLDMGAQYANKSYNDNQLSTVNQWIHQSKNELQFLKKRSHDKTDRMKTINSLQAITSSLFVTTQGLESLRDAQQVLIVPLREVPKYCDNEEVTRIIRNHEQLSNPTISKALNSNKFLLPLLMQDCYVVKNNDEYELIDMYKTTVDRLNFYYSNDDESIDDDNVNGDETREGQGAQTSVEQKESKDQSVISDQDEMMSDMENDNQETNLQVVNPALNLPRRSGGRTSAHNQESAQPNVAKPPAKSQQVVNMSDRSSEQASAQSKKRRKRAVQSQRKVKREAVSSASSARAQIIDEVVQVTSQVQSPHSFSGQSSSKRSRALLRAENEEFYDLVEDSMILMDQLEITHEEKVKKAARQTSVAPLVNHFKLVSSMKLTSDEVVVEKLLQLEERVAELEEEKRNHFSKKKKK